MEGKGYYVATLLTSGARVRDRGLFARGNGRWVIDEQGLSFLRTLTRTPIRIPFAKMRAVRMSGSSWWAGKGPLSSGVVEVEWLSDRDATSRVSGFVFAGKREENAGAHDALVRGLERSRAAQLL